MSYETRMTLSDHRNKFPAPRFKIWSYKRPARSRWMGKRSGWQPNGDMVDRWAYAPLSQCGTFYDMNQTVSGFSTEAEARAEAAKQTAGRA